MILTSPELKLLEITRVNQMLDQATSLADIDRVALAVDLLEKNQNQPLIISTLRNLVADAACDFFKLKYPNT